MGENTEFLSAQTFWNTRGDRYKDRQKDKDMLSTEERRIDWQKDKGGIHRRTNEWMVKQTNEYVYGHTDGKVVMQMKKLMGRQVGGHLNDWWDSTEIKEVTNQLKLTD